MLAQAVPTVSLSLDEQRIAVHRRLYHRPQIQPLFRLRTHAAGNRALVADGECRAARGDGAVAGAHGRGRAGPARSRAESGLNNATSCTKAFSVLIESEPGFRFLFRRVFFTRTGTHFARKR